MPGESEKFTFGAIDWSYVQSNKITPTRMQSGKQRGRPIVADVTCKVCGESWRASEGGSPGYFSHAPGVILLECPSADCGANDAVRLRDLT
jgi:hypothetical protein